MFRLNVAKKGLIRDKKYVRSFFGMGFVKGQAGKIRVPSVIGKTVLKALAVKKAIELADNFMKVNRAQFMAKSVAFQMVGLKQGAYSQSVRYEQKHAGLPVYRAQLVVGQRKVDGYITSAISTLDSEIPAELETKPKLTAVEVKEKILQKREIGFMRLDEPKLYVYRHTQPEAIMPPEVQSMENHILSLGKGEVGKVYLVWQTFVDTREPHGSWEFLVDASNGEFVAVKDRRFYAMPKGKVFRPDPIRTKQDNTLKWSTKQSVLNTARVEVELENLDAPDQNGYYRLKGKWVRNIDKEDPAFEPPKSKTNFRYGAKNRRFRNVMAYYYVDRLVTYLRGLGITGYNDALDAASPLSIDPQGYSGLDNSHFKPDASDPYIALGEDELFGGVPDATDPAVIVHEYGHALHNYLLGEHDNSPYEEGFCDFLSACWLDRYNTTQHKREEVMLWESADSTRQPPFPRSVKMNCDFNDPCFNNPTGYDAYKAGDIHASALWKIYENLGGNNASASERDKAADIIISSYLDALVIVQDNKPLKALVNGLILAYENRGGKKTDIQGPYDDLGPWETR